MSCQHVVCGHVVVYSTLQGASPERNSRISEKAGQGMAAIAKAGQAVAVRVEVGKGRHGGERTAVACKWGRWGMIEAKILKDRCVS